MPRWLSPLLLLTLLAAGCPRDQGRSAANYPEAVVYEGEPSFVGDWVGEVANAPGLLVLTPLGAEQIYGIFYADDESREYALIGQQRIIQSETGARARSNLLVFDWQDGEGGRGRGWLLISRDERAITGSFGFGTGTEGLGTWTLKRDTSADNGA
jgi:hypothetical protein